MTEISSLVSGGTTLRTACGSRMFTSVIRHVMPMAVAASVWP